MDFPRARANNVCEISVICRRYLIRVTRYALRGAEIITGSVIFNANLSHFANDN
jgi:hypothetical protein